MAFGDGCLHAGDIGSKGHEGEHFLLVIWYSFRRRGDGSGIQRLDAVVFGATRKETCYERVLGDGCGNGAGVLDVSRP